MIKKPASLEIVQRSQKLLAAPEEKVGAFVMDAYNHQAIYDEAIIIYELIQDSKCCYYIQGPAKIGLVKLNEQDVLAGSTIRQAPSK